MKLAVFEILSQKNVISETLTESTIAINTSKIIEVYDHEKGSSIKIYTSPRHIGYVYVSESKQQVLSQLGYQAYIKILSLRQASRNILSVSTDRIYFAYSVKERTKISYFNGTRMTSASLKMTMEEFVREFNEFDTSKEILSAYKTKDTTRISTTTFEDDPHLSIPLEANSYYSMKGYLLHNEHANADMKWRFAAMNDSHIYWNSAHSDNSRTPNIDTGSTVTVGAGVGNARAGFIVGLIYTGSTNVTLKFQWAQNILFAGNSTMMKGSWIEVVKMD